MTREEHLSWAKKRAHEYLARGKLADAVTSMASDLDKHPKTKVPDIIMSLGLLEVMNNNTEGVRRFIDGFN